jgi:hypothetical protein
VVLAFVYCISSDGAGTLDGPADIAQRNRYRRRIGADRMRVHNGLTQAALFGRAFLPKAFAIPLVTGFGWVLARSRLISWIPGR